MGKAMVTVGAAVVALTMAAVATGAPRSASELIDALIACSDMSDGSARLACFDARVAELKAARTKKPKDFADREIRREAVEFREISSTIASVTPVGYGRWVLVLADHSVWQSTQLTRLDPEAGSKVVIKKASISGYRAVIDGNWTLPVRQLR